MKILAKKESMHLNVTFVVCGVPDKSAIIKNVLVRNRKKIFSKNPDLKNYLHEQKLVKSNE